jgi:DinB superfamily
MADRKQALIESVETARREVLDGAAGFTAEQWSRASANEGWSAKDTLAHLASIEARLRAMLQLVLDGGTWPVDAPDLDAYNARCVAERRAWPVDAPDLDAYKARCVAERRAWPPEQVIAELRASGAETRRFLEALQSDDLDRRWTHPARGEVTLGALVEIIPRHLREHGEQLRAAGR